MDLTERKITKIAREASKLAVRTLKEDGIGTAEYDFIHLVRHHPGITQAEVREQLRVDKGAAARRAASLEAKGYLIRQANPKDGRSQLLFATEKAEGLRNSKAQVETAFYEWLLASCRRRRRSLSAKRWTPSIAVPSRRAGRASPHHGPDGAGEGTRHE
ncbi:MAG: MarR family winged helix-turn-helix transcriptional regulator [Dysosmobacter sp.]